MLDLSIAAINDQITHYFWPALRILALFTTAPIFSEKEVGKKVKIGLSLFLSFLVGLNLPATSIAIFSYEGLWLGIRQIIIGSAIGFTIQLVFVSVRIAGEIIGLQMGLSFATFFDPAGGQNMPVISRILNLLATLLFLTFNGHLWLLQALIDSFTLLPVSREAFSADGFWYIIQMSGIIFSSALKLGLPVISLLLAINLILGLLNRLTPQLSIFVIGFPLTLTIGMALLSFIMYTLTPFFERLLKVNLDNVSQMLIRLAGA